MRIYYIGQINEGGTCRERMHTLRSLGHDVVSFDLSPWTTGGNRVFRSLAHRVTFGPHVWEMNRALIAHSRSIGPVNLVWMDKGHWIYPETLDAIREQTRGRLLHYTPDAQFFANRSRYFQRCVPLYDWVVTTKPFELEKYEKSGAREILFALQGFDPRFMSYRQGPKDAACCASDVCFVGHCQPHYAACLRAASEVTGRLRVWGRRWPEYAKRNEWALPYVCGNGAWGEDYLRALASTKIALGLLGKHIPETTTTRSFEIPAMGIFLLAERTDDHLALFEEGKEAEFFGDDEELKDKLRFYLANHEARKTIAAAGRERCLRSGYSSTEQLANIIANVNPQGKCRL
jgi:spore maturation protein CgeB